MTRWLAFLPHAVMKRYSRYPLLTVAGMNYCMSFSFWDVIKVSTHWSCLVQFRKTSDTERTAGSILGCILTFILLMWRIGQAPNSIPIYSYIQQGATSHSLCISGNCCTCFWWYFHPSSGAAVDTVVCVPDDRWKYHPKHVEKFPDIHKLCDFASCWIYLRWTYP
jgi:hypothetical protein